MRFGLRPRLETRALPLTYYEHPVLRRQSAPIAEVDDHLRVLAQRMIVTMHENDGIGLAAPQVGRNIRLIVIDIPPPQRDGQPLPYNSPGEAMLLPRMPIALVNPVLEEPSEATDAYDEGCLSIPELRGTVVRPCEITLQAMTLDKQTIRVRCAGLLSRCLQHEVDHLNGVLFVDHLSEEERAALAPELRRMNRQTQAQLKRQQR